MLRVEELNMIYSDSIQALKNVSLIVPDNHIYCLLGDNGAGKSTLIHLFLDFFRPTSGNTFIDKINVQDNPVNARKRIAYLPDQVELYETMTGFENLSFFCKLARCSHKMNDLQKLFNFVKLNIKWGREPVCNYSRGMKQKLGLAILLGRRAKSFLLDEPTLGLDPQSSRDLLNTLLQLKDSGASILMSTHDLFRAQKIADTIGILTKGQLVLEIPKSQIKDLDLENTLLDYMEGTIS